MNEKTEASPRENVEIFTTHKLCPRARVEVVLEKVTQPVGAVVPPEDVHRSVVDGARVEISRGRHIA